jgi:ABC-type proline/glycine betaine transport system permease subunit
MPQELIEAADAFKATNRQTLMKIQISLAMPIILAVLIRPL